MGKKIVSYGFEVKTQHVHPTDENEANDTIHINDAKELIAHELFKMIKKHIKYEVESGINIDYLGPQAPKFKVYGEIFVEESTNE